MDRDASDSPGFLSSLRVFFDGILAGAQDRFELLSAEILEEKYRLIQISFWISAIFFTGALATGFACLSLVYACPARVRLAVLAGLAVFFLLAFGAAIGLFRRFLARQPRPLADTLGEWEADRECTQPKS